MWGFPDPAPDPKFLLDLLAFENPRGFRQLLQVAETRRLSATDQAGGNLFWFSC